MYLGACRVGLENCRQMIRKLEGISREANINGKLVNQMQRSEKYNLLLIKCNKDNRSSQIVTSSKKTSGVSYDFDHKITAANLFRQLRKIPPSLWGLLSVLLLMYRAVDMPRWYKVSERSVCHVQEDAALRV